MYSPGEFSRPVDGPMKKKIMEKDRNVLTESGLFKPGSILILMKVFAVTQQIDCVTIRDPGPWNFADRLVSLYSSELHIPFP
jgi:hypothetical protein